MLCSQAIEVFQKNVQVYNNISLILIKMIVFYLYYFMTKLQNNTLSTLRNHLNKYIFTMLFNYNAGIIKEKDFLSQIGFK